MVSAVLAIDCLVDKHTSFCVCTTIATALDKVEGSVRHKLGQLGQVPGGSGPLGTCLSTNERSSGVAQRRARAPGAVLHLKEQPVTATGDDRKVYPHAETNFSLSSDGDNRCALLALLVVRY